MNLEFFNALHSNSAEKIQQQDKRSRQYSRLRSYAALAAGGFFVAGYMQGVAGWYWLGALTVAVFLMLVRRHQKIEDIRHYYTALQMVAGDYLARFGKAWKASGLTGDDYLSDDFLQAEDLDIFGNHSLYQYICAARTPFGRECLGQWLRSNGSCIDLPSLALRQQAVAELAAKKEFTAHYQALARPERDGQFAAGHEELTEFIAHVQRGKRRPALLGVLLWVLPAATLVFLIASVVGIQRPLSSSAFLLCAAAQLSITLLGFYWNHKLLNPIYRFERRIAPYRKLVAAIEAEAFDSPYLQALQERVRQPASARSALQTLERIADAVASRYNAIAFFICNSLFLYDFHCAEQFLRWCDKNKAHVEIWLQTVGEFEALLSLGVICHVKSVYSFPEVRNSERPLLAAEDLRHPLIDETSCVGNDFAARHGTCIITGSNMSGKTTFLRSIGINLILAYAGGPVAAKRLMASPMHICTSMRVQDNISQGVSTFYAELLRIKEMINYSRQNAAMLALIDEIYKGTNSNDRIIGARETVKQLAKLHVLTMLTTHDFELCDLEDDRSVEAVNYHFSEHYLDDEILFDYKMKSGRCRTTNARHLLRMAGILPEETL